MPWWGQISFRALDLAVCPVPVCGSFLICHWVSPSEVPLFEITVYANYPSTSCLNWDTSHASRNSRSRCGFRVQNRCISQEIPKFMVWTNCLRQPEYPGDITSSSSISSFFLITLTRLLTALYDRAMLSDWPSLGLDWTVIFIFAFPLKTGLVSNVFCISILTESLQRSQTANRSCSHNKNFLQEKLWQPNEIQLNRWLHWFTLFNQHQRICKHLGFSSEKLSPFSPTVSTPARSN